jgi:hypothetical protein
MAAGLIRRGGRGGGGSTGGEGQAAWERRRLPVG